MARNQHIITRDIRVGKIAAEEDEDLLFECFVDNAALSDALDVKNNASILSGRTGSGKSAIIQYINRKDGSSFISPSDMALTHISNSNIIRFLNDIGADLNLFFQTIWKHVLLVEFIRLKYKIKDEEQSQTWYSTMLSRFKSDRSKEKALEYLENYAGDLWISIDENVRQLTTMYEEKLQGEIGVDVSKFASKAGYGANMSQQNKIEYIARARKIMNSSQLQDLSKVITMLSGESNNGKDKYYILIDQLDNHWVDDSIRYRLINALVEAISKFRPIRNLKIIIALRTDVIERSIQENHDSGFQREKFRDYIINIEWDEKKLKELINKRISLSFKRKYSPQKQVIFDDIFSNKIKNHNSFDYMIERTLLRPRDIISFTNECLKTAENKSILSPSDISFAEKKYSQYRYEALVDEWSTAFPYISTILELLRGRDVSFKLSSLNSSDLEGFALEIMSHTNCLTHDPLIKAASNLYENSTVESQRLLSQHIAFILYRVSAVGLKLSSKKSITYSYKERPIISTLEIGEDTSLRVVKMLHSYFGLNDSLKSNH